MPKFQWKICRPSFLLGGVSASVTSQRIGWTEAYEVNRFLAASPSWELIVRS